MRLVLIAATAAIAAIALTACGERPAPLASEKGYGPHPVLPAPQKAGLLPTVKIADRVGWPTGAAPTAAERLQVKRFAGGLMHPRWLYVLPNGDVLVAETAGPIPPPNAEKRPFSLRDWAARLFRKKAGAHPFNANRISLLRDADHDGVAELSTVFITGLNAPIGMTLVGHDLYVADTDAVLRFPYTDGETHISAAPVKLTDLPAFPIDHHWTKNIIASPDGAKLYATVGSNSNVGENGLDREAGRATIWEIDRATGAKRIFASGLRNPNGLAWEPTTHALWTAVNERDELGDDLVPDYMTSVKDGGFYGWPYSYYGQHIDARVNPQRPDLVARAIVPDYALGAHTASLGLTFYAGNALPPAYLGGAFVGQHGSWNRSVANGYKVVFVPFNAGKPAGPAQDILTGFLNADGKAQGRPVGVAVDADGGLLVADDVGDSIWRVIGR